MDWLTWVAWASLALAVASAGVVIADMSITRPKMMPIMYLVWPTTALWAGAGGLYAYLTVGRNALATPHSEKPRSSVVAVAATHCGSGCTLGDIVAEAATATSGLVLLGHAIFAAWLVDYAAAFIFGIAFQYFTIRPMTKLSFSAALGAALKADTASLTAWQVGMYGFMAIVVFGLAGHELDKLDPTFWFAMQGAMVAGFVTSLPVNWWLLRAGVKEAM